MSEGLKVIVTGSHGLIGSELATTLQRAGDTLKKQRLPFKRGAGGKLGSGKRWLSWMAIDDEIAAILHLIRRETLRGPVNATAPNPVTNAEYTAALGAVLRRPTVATVPR